MQRFKGSKAYLILSIFAAAAFVFAAAFAVGQEKAAKVDGKAVFEQKCLKCHKPAKFKDQHNSRKDWELILSRMERNSCVLSDAEMNAVADYLSKQYGE